MRKYFRFLVYIVIGLSAFNNVYAQDAGEILQQIERDFPEELPEEEDFSIEPLPPEIKPIEGLSITITSFEFAGNSLVDTEELNAVTAEYLNREINFIDLQNAAARVAKLYRQKGYLARVYIPEQEIAGDSVRLQIVEAIFGKVQRGEMDAEYAGDESLDKWVTENQEPGENLRPKNIDRAILLMGDLPGVKATGNLTRGARENETDFLMSVKKGKPYRGTVAMSNDGSRSTGAFKTVFDGRLNSPFLFGDSLGANLSFSEGTKYVRTAYSMPLGHRGLSFSANASYMEYEVIKSLNNLDAEGSSDTVQLGLRYPIIRQKKLNLYVATSLSVKGFENLVTGNITSDYNVNVFDLQLSGNNFDRFLGRGDTQGSINFVVGHVDLSGSPNQASDQQTVSTGGSYEKVKLSLQRRQSVTEMIKAGLRVEAQYASKNLDSSERMSFGGATSIRAYPSGEASGSEGTLAELFLSYGGIPNFTLVAFYDWGEVLINKENNFFGAPALNRYKLKGAGASALWKGPKGISASITASGRVGDNPNPSFTGDDKDGTLIRDRVWATVSWSF